MTSSVPDGISFAALQRLVQDAPEKTGAVTYDGKTKDEIIEIAIKHLNNTNEEFPHPLVHKVMVLKLMQHFIQWHHAMASEALSEGKPDEASDLTVDAGRLSAAYDLIRFCDFNTDDFTQNSSED